MSIYLELLSPIITMVLLYYYFKSDRMQKLRGFMNRLFWVDKFEGKSKGLLFGAKFFLIFYLFYILNFSISSIIALDFKMFLWIGLGAIVAPIMYRILMSVQRIFYKI
jgi:hypothetical protein